MQRIVRLLSVVSVNAAFSLCVILFLLGQFVCIDTHIGFLRTTVSVDATGVSLTKCGQRSTPLTVVFPEDESTGRWRELFPLISIDSWENIAFAYDRGFVQIPCANGDSIIELRSPRFGVRHWLLILTTCGLLFITHMHWLVSLFRKGRNGDATDAMKA